MDIQLSLIILQPQIASSGAWDVRHEKDPQLVDGGRRHHALRHSMGKQRSGPSSVEIRWMLCEIQITS